LQKEAVREKIKNAKPKKQTNYLLGRKRRRGELQEGGSKKARKKK
jgi:hypothetical protein